MKNSARYPKLWLKKLKEIPLKEDADSAWASMNMLLDQQLPINAPKTGQGLNPVSSKWIKLFTYVVPAAMTVGTVAYLMKGNDSNAVKPLKDKKAQELRQSIDTTQTDTLASIPLSAFDTARHHDLKEQPGAGSALTPAGLPLVLPATAKSSADREQRDTADGHGFAHVDSNVSQGLAQSDTAAGQSYIGYRLLRSSGFSAFYLKRLMNIKNDSLFSTALEDGLLRLPVRHPAPLRRDAISNTRRRPIGNAYEVDMRQGATPARIKDTRGKAIRLKRRRGVDTLGLGYGMEVSSRIAGHELSYGLGVFARHRLGENLLLQAGFRLNTPRTFASTYSHKSFERPDSLPSFKFTDSRKLTVIDIPVSLEYRLSGLVDVKVGPVLSLPIRQFGVKLSSFGLKADSTSHEQDILQQLKQTKVNKINLGFGFGFGVHLGRFEINTSYEFLKPYVFSSALGTNRKSYQGVQFGLAYKFR